MLRATPELAHTVLITITGYGQPDDRLRSRDAGFHEHLTKPVDLATIESTVLRLTYDTAGA